MLRKNSLLQYTILLLPFFIIASCSSRSLPTPTTIPSPVSTPTRILPSPTVEISLSATGEEAASNPFAGDTAWIAYQTDRGGLEGIWLIHPDGMDDHKIATTSIGEFNLPDWSPDGKRIIITSRNTGGREPLYEYDLAAETYTQVFRCEEICLGDDEPVYSPDGSSIVFIRALGPFLPTGPSDCGIWIGDMATGEVKQITSNTDPPCDREYFPRWSPDGTQLTYWRDLYSDDGQLTGTAVYTMNTDGTNVQRLTDPAMFAGDGDWSPDGEWIVFSTYPLHEFDYEISNLYRFHPDGSGLEQLTFYDTPDLRATQPRYTPDGKWIVFTAVRRSDRSLWAIPSDGGDPVVIVKGGIYTHGTWQP